MNVQRLVIALTAVNLILVLIVLAHGRSAVLQTEGSVLRAEAIELVDARGQTRAQLNVEPNGEAVFRLLDEQGTIRVKVGASEDGSGLLLLDESTEPGVHILAQSSGTSLTLTGTDGQQHIIRP
jgi:hypothetical protein